MLNPSIFREYDIRGLVDKDFDAVGVQHIGQAFGTKITRESDSLELNTPLIIIAYDGRLSSPTLAENITKGLLKTGVRIINIGCGPTPLLYFSSHHFKANGAIMITGSHNPPEFNGFKMIMDQRALFGSEIKDLNDLISKNNLENKSGGTMEKTSVHNIYTQHIIKDFQSHYKNTAKMCIAWDPGNGAAGEITQDLLAQIDGEHYLINGEIDGTFPNHHPDPTIEENMSQLCDVVNAMGCDFGIGFDGDGDRIGIVDDKGRLLFGDQLMALFAEEVLETHKGATIIADVKTSKRLFDTITDLGGIPLMWRTGHSLIKKKMRDVNSPLGGEMSGHIFFNDRYFGYDDALYAALRFIGILSQKKIKLSKWIDNLTPVFNTPEIKIPCSHEGPHAQPLSKFDIVNALKACLDADKVDFNPIDGVRVTTKNGWWLLRASNTEDILVARAEAPSEKKLEFLLNDLEFYLKRAGLKDTP